MSELKLQKLLQLNERLKEEENLPRIKVSEASQTYLGYTSSTPDPLIQTGKSDPNENPFLKKTRSGGCVLV